MPLQARPELARQSQALPIDKDQDIMTVQLLNIPATKRDQIFLTVLIEGAPCKMHLDTESPI